MHLNEYQTLAAKTAGEFALNDPTYTAMGLVEEAGEYAGIIKHEKWHGWKEDKDSKLQELGDMLWYLSIAAKYQGFTLEEVARHNVEKLKARYPEGFTQHDSINRQENKS